MKKRFLLFCMTILCGGVTVAQTPCAPLEVTPDTTIMAGGSVQLYADTGFESYTWTPATGLDHPFTSSPIASPGSTTTYIVSATTDAGPNLIYNGDFALGNVGFTSDQTYNSTYSPCDYYVNNVFFNVATYDFPDHSIGSDNMFMSIDGCYTAPTKIYETTVAITHLTDYYFSFWASRADAVQPHFEIHLIGNVTGDMIAADLPGIPYTGTFTWDEYAAPVWNSGANTSVTVRVINLETNGYGNDFCVDDIDLHQPACTVTDTVKVTVINGAAHEEPAITPIQIPNIITPNGDGINDTFRIAGLPQGSSIHIYDRWGVPMLQTGNYLNDWSTKNDGVYFYILQTPAGASFHGYIQVNGH